MKKINLNKIEKWITIFFLSTSVFFLFLTIEGTILAFINQFKILYIYFSLIIDLILIVFFTFFLKKNIKNLPNLTFPALFLIILISVILTIYPHDSLGGADQAIYSNLAVHLADHSSFGYPSYLNNLPGNYIENAKTYFQGYPIWLGIQKILLGTHWMLQSNVLLIILGLSSLFLVSSYLGGNKIGFISIALFSSSMPFLWFSRETMSEVFSFFLIWSLILFLLLWSRTKQFLYLFFAFLYSWVFALTRFEGFLLQFVFLLIFPFLLFLNKITLKKIVVISIFFILIITSNIYVTKNVSIPIYLNNVFPRVGISIVKGVSSLVHTNISSNKIEYSLQDTTNDKTLFKNLPIFIFRMIAKYNFVLIIFSIFLITTLFLVRFKKLDQSKKFFFIILILLIPEYYKLIDPNVTLSQPWLYRRYMYALLPLGYLCFVIFLERLKNTKLLIILSSMLFIINIILSSPILFLKNNWILIDKIEEITKNISQQDLVLIDYRQPLEDYDARTFLIVQKGIRTMLDWQLNSYQSTIENKKFDNNSFSYKRIFLLSTLTAQKVSFPSYSVFKRKELNVNYVQLIPSCQLRLLKEEEGSANIYNYQTISLASAIQYCSQTTNEISKYNGQLYLYELIYQNQQK